MTRDPFARITDNPAEAAVLHKLADATKPDTIHTRWKWELWRDGRRTHYDYQPTRAKAMNEARKKRASARAFWKAKGRKVDLAAYVQRVDTITYDAEAL